MADTPNQANIIVEADFSVADQAREDFERDLETTAAAADAGDGGEPERAAGAPTVTGDVITVPAAGGDGLDRFISETMATFDAMRQDIATMTDAVEQSSRSDEERSRQERDDQAAGREEGGGDILGIGAGLKRVVGQLVAMVSIFTLARAAIRDMTTAASELNSRFKTETERLAEVSAPVAQALAEFEIAEFMQRIRIAGQAQADVVDALRRRTELMADPTEIQSRTESILKEISSQNLSTNIRDIMNNTMIETNQLFRELNIGISAILETIKGEDDPTGRQASRAMAATSEGVEQFKQGEVVSGLSSFAQSLTSFWFGMVGGLVREVLGTNPVDSKGPTEEFRPAFTGTGRDLSGQQRETGADAIDREMVPVEPAPAQTTEPTTSAIDENTMSLAVERGVERALTRAGFGAGDTAQAPLAEGVLPKELDTIFNRALQDNGLA